MDFFSYVIIEDICCPISDMKCLTASDIRVFYNINRSVRESIGMCCPHDVVINVHLFMMHIIHTSKVRLAIHHGPSFAHL